ncbi:MAG: hypothetical protein LBQ77_08115 [Treponema sp.]|jgi:hypothetical protein|nr:hypothetical protein [Treponema sp.]
MKRFFLLIGATVHIFSLSAQDFRISGRSDTTVMLNSGTGDAPEFSYGIEEYVNLRIQTTLGEYATFYGAFNLIASSGIPSQNASALGQLNSGVTGMNTSSFIFGDNYTSAVELERLYIRINSDFADLDLGLMRLAFGFATVFGPMDFFNYRNPLFPDARPRGILGYSAAFYPRGLKVTTFGTAPVNPLLNAGFRFGLSAEQHWRWGSVQGLYSYETPKEYSSQGVHRFGASMKIDWKCGIVSELLYALNADSSLNGLAATVGADYSMFDGKLYLLAEYLFNGDGSSTARNAENIGGFLNNHYLYASGTYSITDYTTVSLAVLSSLSDGSLAPIVSASHELFQGFNLSCSARIPLDTRDPGELGPTPPQSNNVGSRIIVNLKAQLKF